MAHSRSSSLEEDVEMMDLLNDLSLQLTPTGSNVGGASSLSSSKQGMGAFSARSPPKSPSSSYIAAARQAAVNGVS